MEGVSSEEATIIESGIDDLTNMMADYEAPREITPLSSNSQVDAGQAAGTGDVHQTQNVPAMGIDNETVPKQTSSGTQKPPSPTPAPAAQPSQYISTENSVRVARSVSAARATGKIVTTPTAGVDNVAHPTTPSAAAGGASQGTSNTEDGEQVKEKRKRKQNQDPKKSKKYVFLQLNLYQNNNDN